MHFRVVIVTRDSARWIGFIAAAYKRLGLKPLYLVHDKSSDGTADALQDMGEDVRIISIPHDRVESALAQFSDLVREEWVLRMDDDELPSRKMIRYTTRAIGRIADDAICFSRRETLPNVSPLSYPTMEPLFSAPLAPFHLDPQVRAFRHRQVAYRDEIHTPGFAFRSLHVAPADAYMVHFNLLVRSLSSRLAKLARYEKQSPGAGTLEISYTAAPELLPVEELRARAFETREFDALVQQLSEVEDSQQIEEIETEFEEKIREFISSRPPADRGELMLAALRERIYAIPKPVRAFFKLT